MAWTMANAKFMRHTQQCCQVREPNSSEGGRPGPGKWRLGEKGCDGSGEKESGESMGDFSGVSARVAAHFYSETSI